MAKIDISSYFNQIGNLVENALKKRTGKNLFDKESSGNIDGFYLYSNGNLISNSLYFVSHYIVVIPNTSYIHSNFEVGGAYCIIYDSNKNFVAAFNSLTITIPENGHFIRMSGTIAKKNSQQFEAGSSATSYEAYDEYIPLTNAIASIYSYISGLSISKKLDKKFGKNLLDKNDSDNIIGSYLNSSGGISSNVNYGITGFISCTSGQNLVANFNPTGGFIWFYDINKNKLSHGGNSTPSIIVPSEAFYVRFSGVINGSFENKQVEIGTISTSVEEFTDYEPVGFLQRLSPSRQIECILPSKMYFVKNKQSCVYFENVLLKNLSDATTLFFNKGTNYNKQVTFNFQSAATNQAMTALVIRNLKKGLSKAITYNVVDPAINNGKTINVLHVGDSFADIGIWVKECKTLLNAQGVTYNEIGTTGNSTFKAEGLSGGTLATTFLGITSGVARIVSVTGVSVLPQTGHPGTFYTDASGTQWTIRGGKIDSNGNGKMVVTNYGATSGNFSNFPASGNLTKVAGQTSKEGDAVISYSNPVAAYYNPFIGKSSGQLALGEYLSFWGFANPDIVIFQFTWNDLSVWASDSSIAAIVANFKTAVDHVHSVLPAAKIILSIEPFGSINGNLDWNGKKFTVLRFVELMLVQFEVDSNYNSFVYIAPSYAFVDLVNGYSGGATVTPCERYTAITEASGGDGIHPSMGMYQIADCISQVIANII
jgi:hypothetical protein